MQYRTLGRTGIEVSEIGFGCGAVGGLMVRGDRSEMVRAVKLALDSGITYFDTARMYGDGQSETNIGAILKELGADVRLGTKVKLETEDLADIKQSVIQHVEGSLKRLGMDTVDIVSLHHSVDFTRNANGSVLGLDDVAQVAEGFGTLMNQGKIRYWGMNALGNTDAVRKALDDVSPFGIQACYNLLNPSGGVNVPDGYPFQDYKGILDAAATKQIGVFAIRVLAGGALSGVMDRHANASSGPAPIASGADYAADVAHSQAFNFLVEDGYVDSLIEGAIRFAISGDKISTALVGIASIEQLEQAIEYGNKGPLPAEALDRLPEVWGSLS